MKRVDNVDCHGSSGLSIYYDNENKYYKKRIKNYIKKFMIEFAESLSKELNIPMIQYKFIEEDDEYYLVSTSYDDNFKNYQVIINPFECEGIIDFLIKMKIFCSKFENGDKTYQIFLRQILFSILMCDPDRTVDNMKLYMKDKKLEIAPYMDIDMIFDTQFDDPLFMDTYYKFPEDMKLEIEELNELSDGSYSYSIESINEEFKKEYEEKKESICSYDEEEVFEILDYIYNQIADKKIFNEIINLNYEQIEEKYNLNIPINARIIIKKMFTTIQGDIKLFYENKLSDYNDDIRKLK